MTGSLTERATVAGFLAAWHAVRRLPERPGRAAFTVFADQAWRRQGRAVRQLERNLARVLDVAADDDRVRRLSRDAMRSYARYWWEVFRLPAWSQQQVLERATVDGWSMVTDAVRDRGAVVALPHMGNWDLAGAWAFAAGVPVTAVAERLEPVALYDRFVAFRREVGIEVVGLGDTDLMTTLVDRARDHRLVALVADRTFNGGGVEVPFFGRPIRMPVGAATVALRAGVPLFPVTLWYDDLARVKVHEPVTVPGTGSERTRVETMTTAVARAFESGVREHPRDWHMLQRLWREQDQ